MSSKPTKNGSTKHRAIRGYSDLTVEDLKQMFGIKADVKSLFKKVASVSPTSWLLESLEKGQENALVSEKARSEFIVTPILIFAQSLSNQRISLYSGIRMDIDPEKGLKGVCDFVFSSSPPLPFLEAPLMVLVEAKKNDVEEGIGQCAAEMVAAQIFNAERGNQIASIHGCVTTGTDWQFLRLTGKELLVDKERYFLRDLEKILGILKTLLSSTSSKPKRGKK